MAVIKYTRGYGTGKKVLHTAYRQGDAPRKGDLVQLPGDDLWFVVRDVRWIEPTPPAPDTPTIEIDLGKDR